MLKSRRDTAESLAVALDDLEKRLERGEDLYLGHPNAGLYHLKTYAKNPYQVRGVGTHVARKLDDEIGSYLPEKDFRDGRFAVRNSEEKRPDENEMEARAKRVEETIKAHADAPTSGADLFDDVMEALESPASGRWSSTATTVPTPFPTSRRRSRSRKSC
nr:hypothetical protein [Haladaptatus sp. W1]